MLVGDDGKGLGRPHQRCLELLLLVRVVAREVGALQWRREHGRPDLDRRPRTFNSDTQELITLVTSCLALIDECYRAPAPAAAQTALLQAKLGAAELQPHPRPGGHGLLHPILHPSLWLYVPLLTRCSVPLAALW